MADGKIIIDTEINQKGADKDLDKLDKRLKASEKSGKSATASLAKTGVAIGSVAVAAKAAAAVIKDLTEAYKKQEKAETQLESAAKNNPLLSTASVKALKDYASELQGITVYGDEELIPFMAQLAASGRTQVEIMEIMSAATDMAASGQFTLDSAVRNLNKAYGGLSGELGEAIPEIKALTAEQLKNGGATKLMAERYKGIAAETAAATGTQEQLNNAIGDLKEEFGAGFEKGIAPIRRFFTELISGWANAKRAKREYEEGAAEARTGGDLSVSGTTFAVDQIRKELELLKNVLNSQEAIGYGAKGLRVSAEEYTQIIQERADALQKELDVMKGRELQARRMLEQSDKEREAKATISKLESDYAEYIKQNKETLDKNIEQIKLKAEAEGREVDELEILNAKMQSYVSLIADSNGLVAQNSAIAQDRLKDIRDTAAALDDQNAALALATELQEGLSQAMDAITAIDDRPESEKMRERLDALDEMYEAVQESEQISADQKLAIEKEYTDKRALLEKQLTDTIENEEQARRDAARATTVAQLEIANEFATQYEALMNNIATLAYQMIEDEASIKTAKLEEQYEKGEISLEKYEERKEEIEKDAAKKRYKIAMWEWTSQIASALANTALGVTKALELGLPGLIIGGLIGAAGAVQLATIFGNKPIPPSFTTGGIMGGTSYTGDENIARINSREMILNAGQQKNLFDRINRGDLGGTNVQIYNQASNDVRATAQVNERGVQVFIRKTVAADMAQGRYNDSYQSMQNQLPGVRYT